MTGILSFPAVSRSRFEGSPNAMPIGRDFTHSPPPPGMRERHIPGFSRRVCPSFKSDRLRASAGLSVARASRQIPCAGFDSAHRLFPVAAEPKRSADGQVLDPGFPRAGVTRQSRTRRDKKLFANFFSLTPIARLDRIDSSSQRVSKHRPDRIGDVANNPLSLVCWIPPYCAFRFYRTGSRE